MLGFSRNRTRQRCRSCSTSHCTSPGLAQPSTKPCSKVKVAYLVTQSSSTATKRCSPSFFFNAASEATVIQETMGPKIWPLEKMLTTLWRARTSSSLYTKMNPPLICVAGGAPTVHLLSPAQGKAGLNAPKKTKGAEQGILGSLEELHPDHVFLAQGSMGA